jgi:molybdenum cofactor cytidylyltransferase
MTEGIILAAGSSYRAGTFKPALLLASKPLVQYVLDSMTEVCERIIVVGGHDLDKLRLLLSDHRSVELVENKNYQAGMFSSVKLGVAAVRGDSAFLIPVDIPLVPSHVYRSLLAVAGSAVIPQYGGRRGHPILLRRDIFLPILNEPATSSLRDVIRRCGFSPLEVDSEEILLDVDTPGDLKLLEQRLEIGRKAE